MHSWTSPFKKRARYQKIRAIYLARLGEWGKGGAGCCPELSPAAGLMEPNGNNREIGPARRVRLVGGWGLP